MAHIIKDMRRESGTVTGAGNPYSLNGLVTGYGDFDVVMATADTSWFRASAGADYETFLGTFTAGSPNTLARTTILESSNGNNAVVWGANTIVDIVMTVPASMLPFLSTTLHCGRLTYSSATALQFLPHNGDLIRINGQTKRISAGGIAGLANTSVYVNAVAGQNLGASADYLICVFDNAGTLTADFRTGSRATSTTTGNVGTEILSGDNTRSVIGRCKTNASSQFVDSATARMVISWFNRRNIDVLNVVGSTRTTVSAAYVELNSVDRIEFVSWSEEVVSISFFASVENSGASGVVYASAGIDGATAILDQYAQVVGSAGSTSQLGATVVKSVTEGGHNVRFLGGAGVGTSSYGATRHGLSAVIRG